MSDDVVELVTICTGNIARSPFAMVLLEHEARRRLGDDAPVWVRSAGVHGLEGEPAVQAMREEASARDLDLSRHRGARIGTIDMGSADLLLTATTQHRDRLISLAPDAAPRIFTLKEFARLAPDAPEPPDGLPLRDRVRWIADRAHAARARGGRRGTRDDDVEDPYGGPRDGYRSIAREIEESVVTIADALFGASVSAGR